jgi:DNA-binding XRE family transcriptional regulator/mannose-6-phosphate isomerase-like protein (cupin superfamily)
VVNKESRAVGAARGRASTKASPRKRDDEDRGGPGPVGERLRAHREQAGLSLRGLARAVGVSPSLISQIEHGKATPSVATLYAVVSELDLSLDELFFDTPRGAAASPGVTESSTGNGGPLAGAGSGHWEAPSEGPVLRAANRPSLTFETGVRWERLTASHDPKTDFLYATYPVGGESCPPDALMSHTGREYGIVLEGRLGATVGTESYELKAGDSIAFDSLTPHRLWTIGDEPATAIWAVVGREGDPRVD